MIREIRILSYILIWFLLGIIVCFIGAIGVNAQVIEPTTGFRSQIGLLKTDDTLQWNTSDIGGYGNMLYFGAGPSYSTWGIPAYMRLITITDISNNYSYKISYNMTIFTPNSVSNTWDSSKLDNNYNLIVADDQGVVKESKCSVVNTEIISGNNGTFITKSISCVINVNKSQDNAWLSAGYTCKNCSLSSLEQLGYVPQDSYMYITSPVLEQFNDNSNIIVDQNQTIIDQNNKTNEELGNLKDQIQESNKETQDVIKEQFNSCRNSVNLLDINGIVKGRLTNGELGYASSTSELTKTSTSFSFTTISSYRGVVSDFIPISYSTSYIYSQLEEFTPDISIIANFYDENYNYISNVTAKSSFTTPSNAKYVRIGWQLVNSGSTEVITPQLQEGPTATKYEPYGEQICSNKIDETNKELGNINDALTDSSPTDMSVLGDTAGWLPPGPVDSIINLPLTFFLNLSNSLSSECRPVSLKLPYVNKNIELPCMYSIYEKIGITGIGGFLTWVGLICSAVILFNYLLDLYHWVDKTLTMRENTMPGYYEDKWGGGA